VLLRQEQVVIAHGQQETAIVRLNDIPLAEGGIESAIDNVLAAAAAALALAVAPEIIRTGLETYIPA